MHPDKPKPMSIDDIPLFGGTVDQRVSSIVRWISEHVRQKLWTDYRISRDFGQRSSAQILRDRDVFYKSPCLDYTLVALKAAKVNMFDPTLVIEEHQTPESGPMLHCALELKHQDMLYTLDYVGSNRVLFSDVPYASGMRGKPTYRTLRFPGKGISPDDTFYAILGIISTAAFPTVFRHYQFEKHLHMLKQGNTMDAAMEYLGFVASSSDPITPPQFEIVRVA